MNDLTRFNLQFLHALRQRALPAGVIPPSILTTITDHEVDHVMSSFNICLARLSVPAPEIRAWLDSSNRGPRNSLATAIINREYLEYARSRTKDLHRGRYSALVQLGLSFETASFMSQLSSEEVDRISDYFPQLLRADALESLSRAQALHPSVRPQFAVLVN